MQEINRDPVLVRQNECIGNLKILGPTRNLRGVRRLNVEHQIPSVTVEHPGIVTQGPPKYVQRDIAMPGESAVPVGRPLLIDMALSTLRGVSGAEQNNWGEVCERFDEAIGRVGR